MKDDLFFDERREQIVFFRKNSSLCNFGVTILYIHIVHDSDVLHRICCVCADSAYDIIGDAQTEIETGVRRDRIFAIVTMVHRKGRDTRPGDFRWGLFARVWILVILLRPFLMRGYGFLRIR